MVSNDRFIRGTAGDDYICGGPGRNRILARGGNDIVFGRAGNDVIIGGQGSDVLRGGPGADLLVGRSGRDLLLGNAGADTLAGGVDIDWIGGGSGNDTLFGGSGDDIIAGGRGDDFALGGIGVDRCRAERTGNCEAPLVPEAPAAPIVIVRPSLCGEGVETALDKPNAVDIDADGSFVVGRGSNESLGSEFWVCEWTPDGNDGYSAARLATEDTGDNLLPFGFDVAGEGTLYAVSELRVPDTPDALNSRPAVHLYQRQPDGQVVELAIPEVSRVLDLDIDGSTVVVSDANGGARSLQVIQVAEGGSYSQFELTAPGTVDPDLFAGQVSGDRIAGRGTEPGQRDVHLFDLAGNLLSTTSVGTEQDQTMTGFHLDRDRLAVTLRPASFSPLSIQTVEIYNIAADGSTTLATRQPMIPLEASGTLGTTFAGDLVVTGWRQEFNETLQLSLLSFEDGAWVNRQAAVPELGEFSFRREVFPLSSNEDTVVVTFGAGVDNSADGRTVVYDKNWLLANSTIVG